MTGALIGRATVAVVAGGGQQQPPVVIAVGLHSAGLSSAHPHCTDHSTATKRSASQYPAWRRLLLRRRRRRASANQPSGTRARSLAAPADHRRGGSAQPRAPALEHVDGRVEPAAADTAVPLTPLTSSSTGGGR
jgi:hypothetical protein